MSNFLPLLNNRDNNNFEATDIKQLAPCAFQFVQQYPSDKWIITHNKNTYNLEVQVFLENILSEPASSDLSDNNELILYFSKPVSGFANILTYTDTESCAMVVTTTPTPTYTVTPTVTPTNTVTPTPTPTVTPV